MIPSASLSNGQNLPQISFGTWQLKDCAENVRQAIECGITLIDTASAYRNEEEVALSLRSDIQVLSKASPQDMTSAESLRAAFDASRRKLGRDVLDFYLLHWPGVPRHDSKDAIHREKRNEAWKELEKLYTENAVKAIGVSNFSIAHLEDLMANCTVRPMINQIEIHALWPPNLGEVVEFHKRHGIVLQAYSPLGGGEASNSAREGGPNGTQELLSHPVVQDVARQVERTPAQVLIRFLIEQGICVCFRTTNLEHMQKNIEVFGWELPSHCMDQLRKLSTDGQKFCWNPDRIL